MVVYFAGFKYFRWGYRYPEFLRVLKDLFLANPQHTKSAESWRVNDPYYGGFLFQLKKHFYIKLHEQHLHQSLLKLPDTHLK